MCQGPISERKGATVLPKMLDRQIRGGLGETSSTSCFHCPRGKYSSTTGALACRVQLSECPIGMYTVNSTSGRSAAHCRHCPKNYYQHHAYRYKCLPAGIQCKPGEYKVVSWADHWGHCMKCSAGKYQPARGFNIMGCLPCRRGKFSRRGQHSCSNCAPGQNETACCRSWLLCS
jgi:hypothetical protein